LTLPFSEIRYWNADGKTTRAEWYYDQVGMLGHLQPPEG
jgi:hypothetical protein